MVSNAALYWQDSLLGIIGSHFTTLPLVSRLQKNFTIYVGTIRSNRRDIPTTKSTVGRTKGDTKIYHDENGILMVSFWNKGNRPILLVDSHRRRCPVPDIGSKPETVQFCNKTKSDVDTLEKKIRMFSYKRKCPRWPMSVYSVI